MTVTVWVLCLAYNLDFEDGIDRVFGPFFSEADARSWGELHHPMDGEAPRWGVYGVERPR